MKLLVANLPCLIRTPRRFSDILFHLMSRVNVTVFQQQAIHSPLPLDIFHLAEREGGKRRKTWIIIFPSLHFFLYWGLLMCLPFVIMPPPLPAVEMVAYWLLPGTRLKRRKKGMRNCVEFITFWFDFAPNFAVTLKISIAFIQVWTSPDSRSTNLA